MLFRSFNVVEASVGIRLDPELFEVSGQGPAKEASVDDREESPEACP